MIPFNPDKIREDFPILSEKVYGKPLVYFDNGATTQKPISVIEKINALHRSQNASIHRGVHFLSEQMTEAYEEARKKVQQFIHAEHSQEIIFTSGTTGSINLLAFSVGEAWIHPQDEIIISGMEHHSNIIPWQMLCERKNAILKVIPVTDNGELDMKAYASLLSKRTKIVAVNHVSNTLGTVNPVRDIIRLGHQAGAKVLLDGAQAIQHGAVDVQELDCDFYAFSGHKVYGPTGIGVLYGKYEYMHELPPYQGGGDMVDCVTFEKTTYNVLPFKFEAGTSNYIGAIGLGEALDYVSQIGLQQISNHEHTLLSYATEKLLSIPGLRIYGTSPTKISVISFLIDTIHPYDVGMILDKLGIAVRTGTHCTMPLMDRFEIEGTVRVSMAFYNTLEEIDRLSEALFKAKDMLS